MHTTRPDAPGPLAHGAVARPRPRAPAGAPGRGTARTEAARTDAPRRRTHNAVARPGPHSRAEAARPRKIASGGRPARLAGGRARAGGRPRRAGGPPGRSHKDRPAQVRPRPCARAGASRPRNRTRRGRSPGRTAAAHAQGRRPAGAALGPKSPRTCRGQGRGGPLARAGVARTGHRTMLRNLSPNN